MNVKEILRSKNPKQAIIALPFRERVTLKREIETTIRQNRMNKPELQLLEGILTLLTPPSFFTSQAILTLTKDLWEKMGTDQEPLVYGLSSEKLAEFIEILEAALDEKSL